MRRLVLVRHSMPEVEPGRPAHEWRLGEDGRGRVELLAGRLYDFSPDVIWSSREPKAVETAEIVAGSLGVPVQVADGLEEHHRSGAPFFPTRREFEAALERFFLEPDRVVFGSETANEALARFSRAVDGIVASQEADTVVVTHGTVMALYVARVAGVPPMGSGGGWGCRRLLC